VGAGDPSSLAVSADRFALTPWEGGQRRDVARLRDDRRGAGGAALQLVQLKLPWTQRYGFLRHKLNVLSTGSSVRPGRGETDDLSPLLPGPCLPHLYADLGTKLDRRPEPLPCRSGATGHSRSTRGRERLYLEKAITEREADKRRTAPRPVQGRVLDGVVLRAV
jgi:hypothetical protein